MRDASLERRYGDGGLLVADDIRDRHGSGDDPDGGYGIEGKIWRRISALPPVSTFSLAETLRTLSVLRHHVAEDVRPL